MKKWVLYALGIVCVLAFFFPRPVFADELEDIAKKITEIQKLLEESKKASKPLEDNLQQVENDIRSIENSIYGIEQGITDKEKEIQIEEKELDSRRAVLDVRVRQYYKHSRSYVGNSIGVFLGNNLPNALRKFFIQQKSIQTDRDGILKVAFLIVNLQEKKLTLEDEKTRLTALKTSLDKEKAFFATEVAKVKDYQGGLENEIASLTAQQQQIVAQRLASLNIPRSAGTSARGCSDDRGVDPGFSPRFAFFTYGAPHRNGLNQYGAFGRAKTGQNEEQILSEYYPNFSLKKDYDQNSQVNVDGYGSFSIEDYIKHIYEVPNSWGDEGGMAALKAQAVAARSYALNSMQRNGSICTTESCQVFQEGEKGGNWAIAAEATRGWVMMDGDSPGFTQYASTHGGYILNLGKFDGSGGNPGSFAELNERAYDKESPWFYCDWGARSEYSSTAWLKADEVADIANTVLLARKDSSTGDHLYQPDKPHPSGGEVWNQDRVRQELRSRNITPYSSVSDVSVSADFGGGKTTSITINGDGGSNSFSGDEFKSWFNLRAPANIQIVGPLYNVERL